MTADICPDTIEKRMRKLDTDTRTILDALEAALNSLPGARAKRARVRVPGRRLYAPTAAFEVTFGGAQIKAYMEVAPNGFASAVDARLDDLVNYAKAHAGQAVLFAASKFSNPARARLEAAGAGYFDIDGGLLVTAPPVYVRVASASPQVPKALRLGTLVHSQRARIVDHLLQTWPTWLAVTDIPDRTGIVPSVVSTALQVMDKSIWLDTEGSGPTKLRRIKDRKIMLRELADYCANLPPISMRRFLVAETDPARICRNLARACDNRKASYAISGRYAAQVMAGLPVDTRQIVCRMKAGWNFSEVLRDLGARPADAAWNLGIVVEKGTEPVETGERIGKVQYASHFRVWRDLVCGNPSNLAVAEQLAGSRFADRVTRRRIARAGSN